MSGLQVRARITGPVAAIEVIETISNQTGHELDVSFVYPLASDSSIVKCKFATNEQVLEVNIEPISEDENLVPAKCPSYLFDLLSKERANVMVIHLGTIKPGDTISMELAYGEKLQYTDGAYHFYFPIMKDARLQGNIRTDTLPTLFESTASSDLTLPSDMATVQQFTIAVYLESEGLDPTSLKSTQHITWQQLQNGDLTIELDGRKGLLPRDFVISLNPWKQQKPGLWLRTLGEHFLFCLYPPLRPLPNAMQRDVVVLIDGSDNMTPSRFDRARKLTAYLLRSLNAHERFAVVCFNRDLAGYRQGQFCPADEVSQGLQWLAQFEPRGRADLTVLLTRVLQLEPEENRLLSVLLVTAGPVGNEPELFELVQQSDTAIRFFTVSVDSVKPDAFLVELSKLTYGAFYMLGPQDTPQRLEHQLIEDTKQPILINLQLLDRGLSPKKDSLVPRRLGHLAHNRPIKLMGLKQGQGGLEIRGQTPSGQVWGEATIAAESKNPALGVAWALEKASELSRELYLHRGPYSNLFRQQIAALSIKYKLLSDYTFITLSDGQTRRPQPPVTPRKWERAEKISSTSPPGSPRPGLLLPGSTETVESPPPTLKRGLKIKKQNKSTPITATGSLKNTPGLRSKLKPKAKLGGIKDIYGDKPTLPLKKLNPITPQQEATHTPPPEKTEQTSLSYETDKPEPQTPSSITSPPPEQAAISTNQDKAIAPSENPQTTTEPTPPPTTSPDETIKFPPIPKPPIEPDPLQHAKQTLLQDPNQRTELMNAMRVLHISLLQSKEGNIDPQLNSKIEAVLKHVTQLAPRSSVLHQVYEVGCNYYRLYQKDAVGSIPKLQFWLQRFAILFK